MSLWCDRRYYTVINGTTNLTTVKHTDIITYVHLSIQIIMIILRVTIVRHISFSFEGLLLLK